MKSILEFFASSNKQHVWAVMAADGSIKHWAINKRVAANKLQRQWYPETFNLVRICVEAA